MSGAGKRQAGRQDRIGDIHIVGPGLLYFLDCRHDRLAARGTVHAPTSRVSGTVEKVLS